jgi:hypothetical protein
MAKQWHYQKAELVERLRLALEATEELDPPAELRSKVFELAANGLTSCTITQAPPALLAGGILS